MNEFNSNISAHPLSELLEHSLTSTPCVNIRKNAKVRVATGMLVQYLESFTDSIVVRDDTKPIGVLGGREIIQGVYKNPTSDFFETNFVEDVMDNRLNVITADSSLNDLISLWKAVRRAFAIINVGHDDYSVISAKKILEIGVNYDLEFRISEIPKKELVVFEPEATLGEIIKLMLENKNRKILLKDSNQFINDRIIIETIEKFDFLLNRDKFLEIPVNVLPLQEAKIVSDDLTLTEISNLMLNLSHPFVIYEESAITPWDICMILEKI